MSAPAASFSALIDSQLADIEQQLQSLAEAASVVELDQSRVGRLSRMDALQGQAMCSETWRCLQLKKKPLLQAKYRIDDDGFGYCNDCGDAVATGRLAIDPAATLCIGCAERREG